MSETAVRRMTYSDYARIPADGRRHEIIDGGWYMTPAPNTAHQLVSMRLSALLHMHVTKGKLGRVFHAPFDVVLSDTDVVQPDIVFVSTARSQIVTEANAKGAPDLVVEILSPSTAAIDRLQKLALYERYGVREYWLIDPTSKTAEIHEFASPRRTRVYDGAQSFDCVLLPGLTVGLGEIF